MKYVPPSKSDKPTFEVKANSVWDAASENAAAVRPNLFEGLKVQHRNGRTIFYTRKYSDDNAVAYPDPNGRRYSVIVEAMQGGAKL